MKSRENSALPENRRKQGGVRNDQDGRFRKGQSGNPGGRPKTVKDIQKLAREHTAEAMETIVQILKKGRPAERIQAAKIILERGWGRPPQQESESKPQGPIVPVINFCVREKTEIEKNR